MPKRRKSRRYQSKMSKLFAWNFKKYLFYLGVLAALIAGFAISCTITAPRNIDNSCDIFNEYPKWYLYTVLARDRWDISIGTQLAFVRQESRFAQDAVPPRTRLLWFIPWSRKSSAYGYPQAVNETWDWYQRDSGRIGANRDDFADAVDFIGWYMNKSRERLKLGKEKIYGHYLAYHEGHSGYHRKSYLQKKWLPDVAREVAKQAALYDKQLKLCEDDLRRPRWWWPF